VRIVVTGGTGFIGRHLVRHVLNHGHTCELLVRRDPATLPAIEGVGYRRFTDIEALAPADAVVNLAGEWVVGRWTEEKKARIMGSRIEVTRAVVDWIQVQEVRPKVLVSASAVGIYGDRPSELLTEASPPDPRGRFRSVVCEAWEGEALRAESLGVRTVTLRIGNVLDSREGFLGMLIPWLRRAPFLVPFAPRAYNPWIALPDAVRLIDFAMKNERVTGPLNVVGPNPVRLRRLVESLGRVMGKPAFGTLPEPLVRLAFGEFAQSLLESQDVRPAKALSLGFEFEHPDLGPFLRASMAKP